MINENKQTELIRLLELYHDGINSIYKNIWELSSNIKNFWTDVLVNLNYFTINNIDRLILSHLKGILYEFRNNFQCITFYFYFDKNQYFEETKLYKSYHYELPCNLTNCFVNLISKTEESNIKWISHNPTIEIIKSKKKQWKKVSSFFNLFDQNFDQDESHTHLHLIIKHVLEYYLNIIPPINK